MIFISSETAYASGGFKGGGCYPPPYWPGCILKQAKILHQSALFLH